MSVLKYSANLARVSSEPEISGETFLATENKIFLRHSRGDHEFLTVADRRAWLYIPSEICRSDGYGRDVVSYRFSLSNTILV
jgi:hypothetical protein